MPRLHALAALSLMLAVLGGCSNQRHISVVRRDGDRAFAQQDYLTAVSDYQEVVSRDAVDWEYQAKLGETLLLLDRPREAREHLAVAFDLRPHDGAILDLYCDSMLVSGDSDGLLRFLRDRAEGIGGIDDYLRLGRYAALAGDADEAERAFLTAARLDAGQTVGPQQALAEFYRTLGNDQESLVRYRMALYLDPENGEVLEAIRAYGEIPGPSYGIEPRETRPPE
jgi:tetratricopeptide (TPR) repeat protein